MKELFTIQVAEADSSRLESLLNMFRIGLNDWNKSIAFESRGYQVVNYNVACSKDDIYSITNIINGY